MNFFDSKSNKWVFNNYLRGQEEVGKWLVKSPCLLLGSREQRVGITYFCKISTRLVGGQNWVKFGPRSCCKLYNLKTN